MSASAARPLAEIFADASLTAGCGCYWCWGGWGNPCATGRPRGSMHVGRLNVAYKQGLISAADYMAVIAGLDAFTLGTVVTPEGVAR